jgi:hypothetical protein
MLSLRMFGQPPASLLTVKGTIIDSATNKPLGYVTVALQDAKTLLPVKSTLAKDDGSFVINAPVEKNYQLVIAFVGYMNKTIQLKNGSATVVNLGRVLLAASNKQLKEVSVVAVRPLMKQEVDRISYDVQADPESKALDALDMIRKVPLLSVDASDNIKLKGSGNYKILINGKESALMAKNPSDVLKAMPATNIEKIEVITTPPAKYDAEGLAGIINIITKKNADRGYNLGINGRMNTVWGPGLNLNATVKEGKFGLAAYAGFGKPFKRVTGSGNDEIILVKQQQVATINQTGINSQTGGYKYANADLSYEIDSLNLLTGTIEAFNDHFVQQQKQVSSSFDNLNNTMLQGYNTLASSSGSFTGVDAAINYQRGFKSSKDRLLTLSYKYSYSPATQNADNVFSNRIKYLESQFPDFRQYNNSGSKEHTFQLDYAHPLKNLTIEAGAKAILRNNFSDYHRDDRDSTNQQYQLNNNQTNDFTYHQDIYSLYNSYQLKLDKWTAKGGLRLERTTVDADFTSTSSTVVQNYNNLIPSISIQRKFKNNSINLGFTERIQRPGIFQLNPFVDRSNPNFISTGNPNLRPELSHSFELTYSNFSKNAINLGLSYAFSKNAIQNVSSLQSDTVNNKRDTVTYTTYQNLGSNKTLGLNVNTNLAITKKLTLSLNGQINHLWLQGTFNGQFYKNQGYTGNAFANAGYKFDKGYRFGIDAGYFSGDVNLQGKSSAFIFSSYVLTKEFLDKKATVSLVANNPYSRFNTFRSTTTSADFYQTSYNQNIYRTFALRFSYKFGRLNSEIKKNEHGISNDDTKGGKGSGNQ